MGKKVLLVDLDGQAASSRWLGVEGDSRLADAMLEGSGLQPVENVIPGVSLAPASGKLDSISHNLRPTQGSQLRRVLAEVKDRYDFILIDCPPSLGNRLIGNALLASSHAIVPVETSILALDGLRILLTMLDDIRQGFEHDIELIGALGCRFNSRTRLSRLVLAELHRALPGKVFGTAVHETVRMQECPASGKSILEYAPECSAADDYRAVAGELVNGITECTLDLGFTDLTESGEVEDGDLQKVDEFRKLAGEIFRRPGHMTEFNEASAPSEGDSDAEVSESQPEPEVEAAEDNKPPENQPDSATPDNAPAPVTVVPVTDVPSEPVVLRTPSKPLDFDKTESSPSAIKPPKSGKRKDRDNVMVGIAAAVLLGILGIGGWVGFKAMLPSPQAASATQTRLVQPNVEAQQPVQDEVDGAMTDTNTNAADPAIASDADNGGSEDIDIASGTELVISKSGIDSIMKPETSVITPPVDLDSGSAPETSGISPEKAPSDSEGDGGSDAEAASDAPTTQPAPKEPTTQPATKTPRKAKAEDYPDGLTLTGVMFGKTSRRAIISGTVVYEGDNIKDVKIVKILPDSVEIEANGFRFLLGTGPKPVWLKATEIAPEEGNKPDTTDPASDSEPEPEPKTKAESESETEPESESEPDSSDATSEPESETELKLESESESDDDVDTQE